MAKVFPHYANIDGVRVGYSITERSDRGRWMVKFRDAYGKPRKHVTEVEARGKNPPAELHDEAARVIRNAYKPLSLFPELGTAKGWDELLEEVEKTSPNTRAETFRQYRQAVRAFREVLPEVASPLDVSEDRIKRFGKLWLAGKKSDGKPRSPVTLSYYLRGLSGFTGHLVELGYMGSNPWKGIKAPKGERTRKPVPTEDEARRFFAYVTERFPGWVALQALLNLKAISACRTADVCQIKTADISPEGVLTFRAGITKTKEARTLPLPEDLVKTLKSVAGPVWLWEGLFRELPKYRKQSNGLPEGFDWRTVYRVITNIFREYNEGPNAGKPKFNAHGLRRRAITLTVQATGSVDAAAQAIGVNPATARAHYLDASRAFDSAAVMRKVAGALRLDKPEEKKPEDTK